jgi:hypothetical protein
LPDFHFERIFPDLYWGVSRRVIFPAYKALMKYSEVGKRGAQGAAGGQGDGGKYNIDLLHRE